MKLEEMVQELWDREKIKELTYQYGLAIEAQDEARMANLFTEDGSVDFSSLGRGVTDRKSTRLNSSHIQKSRMPSSA